MLSSILARRVFLIFFASLMNLLPKVWRSRGRILCVFFVGIWVNYNDLTATSLEIMVSKGNHPQMALIQVNELL